MSSVRTALLFLVPAIVVGFFIIMNLFIAILLEAFAHDEEEGDEEEGEGEGGAGGAEEGGAGGKESREAETARSVASWAVSSGARVVPRAEGAADPPKEPRGSPGLEKASGPGGGALVGTSLDRFGPESEVRLTCHAIASHRWFDRVIIALIVASSVCLAIDSPLLDEASTTAALLACLNAIFTLCFVAELAIKVIAMGFVANGPGSYLRQPWNVLDFCIVFNSLLVYLASIVPFFAQLKVPR